MHAAIFSLLAIKSTDSLKELHECEPVSMLLGHACAHHVRRCANQSPVTCGIKEPLITCRLKLLLKYAIKHLQ